MNQTVESRKYYPTALALYITYFVLGVAATIMGQYKQNFAALWGAATLADGSYDVSGVVAVIAAIGLGRLVAFPVAGPLSDRLGRRLSALIGCGLYAIFLLGITFAPNLYVGYALAVVSGMANSFLDTSITPSCMEIFKEKGTIANIFTKLSISIAQFLLPFAIGFVAAHALPFRTIFIATAVIIIADGIVVALFVSAALLKRNVEPAKILVIYPSVALATLAAIYFIQKPVMCLAGGFLLGFFAAGGVLQLVTAVANEMFPKNRGVITSIVMISSSVANYIVISVAGVLTRVGGANGPRLVVLFNMAVTLVGILLAVYLNICQKRERAAQVQ